MHVAAPSIPPAIPQYISDISEKLIANDIGAVMNIMFDQFDIKESVLDKICECIEEECNLICKKNASIFRKYNIAANFEWSDYASELKQKLPIIYRVLSKIVSHSDKRNSRTIDYHNPGMCTAVAILLNERNREMTGLQTLMSLILYPTQVQKQVCCMPCLLS